MISRALCVLLMTGSLTVPAWSADEQPPTTRPTTIPTRAAPPPIATPPGVKEILILPLHVHVLVDDKRPDLNCKLTEDDLARILAKVNRIWRAAGVQFHIQTIFREPPHEPDAFDQVRRRAERGNLGLYRMITNPKTRDLPGLHVYYLHELPPNGVYIGGNVCFVKETASLRDVEGGIDEPIPRVTSHEIGHALGLRHRQDRTNLMASGTTGTTLSEAEVLVARQIAAKNKGVMTIAQARQRVVDVNADDPAAESLRKLLASIDDASR